MTAAIAVLGGLGAAPAAHGASVSSVSIPPSNCFRAMCMSPGGTFVTFAADPGEANRLTIAKAGTASVFTEATLQVRAGGLCVQGAATSASCEGVASVSTADGDDQVDDAAGASVDGGGGNDLLRGAGRLTGGTGSDTLTGTPGETSSSMATRATPTPTTAAPAATRCPTRAAPPRSG